MVYHSADLGLTIYFITNELLVRNFIDRTTPNNIVFWNIKLKMYGFIQKDRRFQNCDDKTLLFCDDFNLIVKKIF